MKKILILSYLEGASRIEFVGRIGGNYAIERQVCDVNACVETLVSHGAEVYVCDLYQKGREIFPRDLTEKAKVVKTPELEELCKSGLDGVFVIGAHAKNGAGNAFYTYTVNEVSWFSYSLNGAELGDIGIAHAYFGYFGIPVLLVSGDDGACREAEEIIKGVVTAIVKKATCRNYATCLLEIVVANGNNLRVFRIANGFRRNDRHGCARRLFKTILQFFRSKRFVFARVVRNGNNVIRLATLHQIRARTFLTAVRG